ncbi:GNAT family N-acetyltransferase [Moritella sp. F3]|uniref:GNAT family N-acetyltransferase n=1 Tax=Moritella sp. F3 TaxID=2718882 RepID=UPI0018E1640A|nr:GNAT family N-acetyltransferase [Moritella sp. F3]GIC76686.1 GNAT family N-acetyltransferase [Moritella sp. F1]GIC80297.1 GNAT family N-acetyltransferase [Moritella sp. F3]
MIIWQTLPFNKLSTLQLYELIKLRVNIFVVEQTCPYPELDDKDTIDDVYHLCGSQNDEIIAYARLLPAGISYENVSLGRVATKDTARGNGLGHQLIIEALKQCEQHWPGKTIDIGAQEYLQSFYQKYGFKPISEVYMEDGIPHIDMRLNK